MSLDPHRHRAVLLVAGLATAVAVALCIGPSGDTPGRPAVVHAGDTVPGRAALRTTTRYAPVTPTRVLDTRSDPTRRRLGANGSLSLAPITPEVSSASGVPADLAQAVVLNITMVDSAGPGFATVWPTGSPQPTVSSLNTEAPSQNVADLVTVPLGTDGSVSVFSSTGADFVIDVQGVYAGATTSTSGRLVPLAPQRAIDTRRGGTLGPAGTLVVDLTSVGVPANVSAALLNVTATNTRAAGYFTVWPGGTMPVASNINVPGPGYTVANQVITRMTAGRITVFSEAGGDVIVDVSGYFTGADAADASTGLFVPLAPARLLDTRSPGPFSTAQPLASGTSLALPVAGRAGVPDTGVQAVALNVTATRTLSSGYLTVWPTGRSLPDTSSLNFVAAGQTVPNHVITALNGGAVSIFGFGGTDVLVDLMGYWTDPSSPSPPTVGPHAFLYGGGSTYGRWDPCDPISYFVNADRADQAMVDQLDLAIAEVEHATGLDFVYAGRTSGGLDLVTPSGADAVLGFSDEAHTPYLAGGVIGVGGGTFDPVTGRVGTGFAFADVNGVSLSRVRATFMHEIAHMVGLDHVPNSDQLMYYLATSIDSYRNGDLEGLWWVGSAQGCLASDAAPGDVSPSSDPDAPAGPVLVVQT